ncbi:MAG: hypothetical protein D6702_03485 [Planctomycetota bacterium]|nr:MAG: hypothetical protein D6702_03485 [Planctomycetota bacterium]
MLSEYGGTGFPTLMFLDAEGHKLFRPEGRDVGSFEKARDRSQEFLELVAKAEQGDAKAKVAAFRQQLELGWFGAAEARERLAGLGKISRKDRQAIERLLVATEVRELAKEAGRDLAKRREAGKRLAEMWRNGQVPEDKRLLVSYWGLIADHAEAIGDKKLMKKVLKEADKTVKSDYRGRQLVKELEQRYKNMR